MKKSAQNVVKTSISGTPSKGKIAKLVEYENENKVINSVISAIIYEQSPGISFEKILQQVRKIPTGKKRKLF